MTIVSMLMERHENGSNEPIQFKGKTFFPFDYPCNYIDGYEIDRINSIYHELMARRERGDNEPIEFWGKIIYPVDFPYTHLDECRVFTENTPKPVYANNYLLHENLNKASEAVYGMTYRLLKRMESLEIMVQTQGHDGMAGAKKSGLANLSGGITNMAKWIKNCFTNVK